ncbi:hypothetical protein [uncultured Jannaschia sp.]|uniref:hypothetical protein n=1 Tax=uncultured Jannaschia sp. TaxID=293347 RepID=UPI00261C4061|nr:hypothetical protein [uncultured Jannaschia sp.]
MMKVPPRVAYWTDRPDVATEISAAAARLDVPLQPLGRGVRRPQADIWIIDTDWVERGVQWGEALLADEAVTVILYGEGEGAHVRLPVYRKFVARSEQSAALDDALSRAIGALGHRSGGALRGAVKPISADAAD